MELESIILDIETDTAAGRGGGLGELLDKVTYAAFDLLDVAFNDVNSALEFRNLAHLVQTIEQHLAKNSRGPLSETGALQRLDPISDRNDNIKVIEHYFLHLTLPLDGTMGSGVCIFCTYHFTYQFPLFKDIVDVFRYHRPIPAKQLTHLLLRKPNGFAIGLDR